MLGVPELILQDTSCNACTVIYHWIWGEGSNPLLMDALTGNGLTMVSFLDSVVSLLPITRKTIRLQNWLTIEQLYISMDLLQCQTHPKTSSSPPAHQACLSPF
jgi:hypothetical protein